MAGLTLGVWESQEAIAGLQDGLKHFEPTMEEAEKARLYAGWHKAVKRSLKWEDEA